MLKIKKIDKKRKSKHWPVLLIISTSYIAVLACAQGFTALLPLVQKEFQISMTQAGLYGSFYFLSATLLAIYSGRLVDRVGVKKGLIAGVAIAGATTVLHSLAPYYSIILILSFVTGIGFCILTPAVNKGVLDLVEKGKRALSIGFAHGSGMLGGFFGAILLPAFGEIYGWRVVIMACGVFAILTAFFLGRFFQPEAAAAAGLQGPEAGDLSAGARMGMGDPAAGARPEDGPGKGQGTAQDQAPELAQGPLRGVSAGGDSPVKEELLGLLGNRSLLWICLIGAAFGASISSISGHFTLYLTHDLLYSPSLAGLGFGFFQAGGIFGLPLCGLIGDSLLGGDRRKGLFLLCSCNALVALAFGLLVSRFSPPPYVVMLLAFLQGFFVLGIVSIYFTAVGEMVGPEKTGVATGFALVFNRTAMVISPPLFGLAADLGGSYATSWVILGGVVLFLTVLFYLFSGRHLQNY